MDLNQVQPRLHVGSCPTSVANIELLSREYQITAVLNLQTVEDFNFWNINWAVMEAGYRKHGIELHECPFQTSTARRYGEDCRRV